MQQLQVPIDRLRLRAARPPSDSDAEEIRWLLDQIRVDEPGFVDAFERLPAARRQRLLRNAYCEQALRHTIWSCDRLQAARALRTAYAEQQQKPPPPFVSEAQLGQTALRQRRPNLAQLTLEHDRSSAALDAYLRRFADDKNCWRVLVERRMLSPLRYFEHFWCDDAQVETTLLTAWLGSGLVDPSLAAQQLLGRTGDLLTLLRGDLLHPDDVLRGMFPQAMRQRWCAYLAQHDQLPSRQSVAEQPALQEVLFLETYSGWLRVPRYLQVVPRPGQEKMRQLMLAGRATDVDCLRSGCLTAADIVQRLEDGRWQPRQVVQDGPVPEALVQGWLEDGSVDLSDYLRGSAEHWLCETPLPRRHVDFALSEPDAAALLQNLPLPPSPRQRRAYAAQMLALHLGQLCAGVAAPADVASRVRDHLVGAGTTIGLCATPACVGHRQRTATPCILECPVCQAATPLAALPQAAPSRPRLAISQTGMWT